MKSKGYAKFLGANKLHHGRCASGESFLPGLFIAISIKVSEKMCMRQSQKVLGCCRTYFCCFPLALADICPWPLLPFFQMSLRNSELKATHNTFRGCRVHFIGQPFSKYLYKCTAWNRDFLWQLFVSLFKRRCCVMKGSYRGIMQFGQIDSEIKLYLVPFSFKSISIKIVNINCWLG